MRYTAESRLKAANNEIDALRKQILDKEAKADA